MIGFLVRKGHRSWPPTWMPINLMVKIAGSEVEPADEGWIRRQLH
jgi:hypothetical protein